MDDIRRFLTALFEFKEKEHYVLVWTLAKKRSAWFTDLEAAARYIEAHSAENCYVGAGLAKADHGQFRRATAQEVVALAGFCADIDYGARKRPDSPTKDQALALLKESPIAPSLIVHTGHGYHAWWLFKEPWALSTDEERNEAHWVFQQWGATLKALAAERGFTIDSVFDLPRVMRCPGTLNTKEKPAVMAELVSTSPWRAASLDPFYEHIREDVPSQFDAVPAEEVGPSVVLDPSAEPGLSKFNALSANNRQFAASYNRSRKDVKGWSASEYDLSLANYAMAAEWTDQEIVDLLIASRRAAGDDLKLRPDYYRRTLEKARQGLVKDQAAEEMSVIAPGDPEAPDLLKAYLKVRIERVIRYRKPEGAGLWYIHVAGARIRVGPITNMRTMNKFLAIVEDATLTHIKVDKGDWDMVLDLLYGMAEQEDMGGDGDETKITASWVDQYLESCGLVNPNADQNKLALAREPFLWSDSIWMSLGAFKEWIYLMRQEQISGAILGAALRELGSEPRAHPVERDGRRTTYNVWRVPAGMSERHILPNRAPVEREPIPDWISN